MSFRLRIVLMTTALIAFLFGIGGSVLVHTTFLISLQKEEQTAVDSNELILKVVQYVGEDSDWLSESDLVAVIANICATDTIHCLQLTCEDTLVYSYQKGEDITEFMNEVTEAYDNQVQVTYFNTGKNDYFLQTTTQFHLNNRVYNLNMGRSLTHIYQVRSEQIDVFQKTFLVVSFFGAFFSWVLATVLTRHLRKLTKASKEIGAGNLSYRSRIKSDDEIGVLSQEFDNMAEKLENNITLLKESAEQKERFMGAFTHEMKTPMTSIIGYADLLRTQKLSSKDETDALGYIFSEAKRLENLSLKMLDLFVADKKDVIMKECSPANLARYVAKHLQNTYAQSNVRIVVKAENGSCLLESDLFQTLLINLLDNARKSMEQGGTVCVMVKMTESGCVLTVTDEGKGIPKEALLHLTEAFYRVDKARARSRGNAGLGLALCEKIVQLHHGSIHFDSEEGVGTVVTVVLNGGQDEKEEK